MLFRILGDLEVVQDDGPIGLGSRQQRAVLAMLALHAGEIVTVDRLIDGLWGERAPPTPPRRCRCTSRGSGARSRSRMAPRATLRRGQRCDRHPYGFWRPITAITLADTDGNPATNADPDWKPLLVTPPYPDYVSGYCGLTGAFTRALAEALDTRDLQVTLTSTAVPGVRSYDSGRTLRSDVVNARVWLGIHFRTADIRGVNLGQLVARWALTDCFAPEGDR